MNYEIRRKAWNEAVSSSAASFKDLTNLVPFNILILMPEDLLKVTQIVKISKF